MRFFDGGAPIGPPIASRHGRFPSRRGADRNQHRSPLPWRKARAKCRGWGRRSRLSSGTEIASEMWSATYSLPVEYREWSSATIDRPMVSIHDDGDQRRIVSDGAPAAAMSDPHLRQVACLRRAACYNGARRVGEYRYRSGSPSRMTASPPPHSRTCEADHHDVLAVHHCRLHQRSASLSARSKSFIR